MDKRDAKDQKLVRSLTAHVQNNAWATLFYWCDEDINNLDMNEAPNSLARAEKLCRVLAVVEQGFLRPHKHVVDWDGKRLFKTVVPR